MHAVNVLLMCFLLKNFAKTGMSDYSMEQHILKEGFSFATMATGYRYMAIHMPIGGQQKQI